MKDSRSQAYRLTDEKPEKFKDFEIKPLTNPKDVWGLFRVLL